MRKSSTVRRRINILRHHNRVNIQLHVRDSPNSTQVARLHNNDFDLLARGVNSSRLIRFIRNNRDPRHRTTSTTGTARGRDPHRIYRPPVDQYQ